MSKKAKDAEFLSVECAGQFYYVQNRIKNYREYNVEVSLPVEHLDKPLWFIKKFLIKDALREAFPELALAGVRTCQIVTRLPEKAVEEGDVIEDITDIEGSISQASTLVSEEFADVEDMLG